MLEVPVQLNGRRLTNMLFESRASDFCACLNLAGEYVTYW